MSEMSEEMMVRPFRLGPVLGHGCTGVVRLGTHIDTGFQVAIKIMKKDQLKSVRMSYYMAQFTNICMLFIFSFLCHIIVETKVVAKS
jgi:serine/threonine protein kinase